MQTRSVPLCSRDAAALLGLAPGFRAEQEQEPGQETKDDAETAFHRDCQSVEAGIIQGFQLATAAGPLCDEPMWGLVFQVRPVSRGLGD